MSEDGRDLITTQKRELPWWVWLCVWFWRLAVSLVTGVFLGVAINIVSTWLTTSKGILPADAPFALLLDHWLIVLLIMCGLLLLAILARRVSQRYVHPSTSLSLPQQNRARMLGRLRYTYHSLLEQSLQGTMWMELGLAEKPDAVRNAATFLWRRENQPERALPSESSIMDVYDQAEHELLILGEPGAGKSTLLLELAQQLVERATKDTAHPLPVILPLASWAVKRSPLQEWIVEQVSLIYNIPRGVSSHWMQEEMLLPLLDGLDEMDEMARPACIAAINRYHRYHLSAPLVIGCRTAEYDAAAEQQRLILQQAIVVQSLTKEQVDAYLRLAGKPVAALRKALKANPTLQELATTPLMLSVLMLTYQGTTVRELPTKAAALQHQVWSDYVEHMAHRKGDGKRYPFVVTRHWLGWLARTMRMHNQSVFYLEHLQPDWLTIEQQHSYALLAIRVPAVLLGILAALIINKSFGSVAFFGAVLNSVFTLQSAILGGALGWLFSRPVVSDSSLPLKLVAPCHKRLRHRGEDILLSLVVGLLIGFGWEMQLVIYFGYGEGLRDGSIFGVVSGVSIFVLSQLLPMVPSDLIASTPLWTQYWPVLTQFSQSIHGRRAWLVFAILGPSVGLSVGLNAGLNAGLIAGLNAGLNAGLIAGLIAGLFYGFNTVLLSLILSTVAQGILLNERLHWTWYGLMRSLFTPKHRRDVLLMMSIIGLSVGLIYGLSAGLDYGLSAGLRAGLRAGLSAGLSIGLLYWVLLGLFQGVQDAQIEDRARRMPNQGIRRSLSNSALLAFISSILISITVTLSMGLNIKLNTWLNGSSEELSVRLRVVLFLAICGGLLVCASRGGLAVLRHYVIRLLLARSHTFPWRAVQFLDDSSTRIFLRRVGGGYSFTHRLLLDYFADQDAIEASTSPLHTPAVSATQSFEEDSSVTL